MVHEVFQGTWIGPFLVLAPSRQRYNIVEQDHRAIKRRCAPMLAMKSFRTAATTLAGVELARRRKGQFTFGSRGPHQFSSLKHAWARALMCNDDVLTVRQAVRRVTFDRDCTRTPPPPHTFHSPYKCDVDIWATICYFSIAAPH
jgi:hypothetical protein